LFETVASAVTVPILAGTTGYNTGLDIGLTEEAGKLGIAGVLAVCPFYSRPSQAGLETHFRAIAGATDLPVVLYDIPVRSGRKIDSTTLVRLAADVPNILGLKDAAGNPGATAAVKANAPADFEVYSGDDAMTLPLLAIGRRRRDRCGDALVRARSGRDVRCLRTRRRAVGAADQRPPVGELRVRNGRRWRRTRYRPRP
jgi:4-hydroxy-tetrahydrodipicolinate synthase